MAIDFVSPFNTSEYQHNLNRIREEREREDYIGIWRVLYNGLTRALKTLKCAEEVKEEARILKEQLEEV